MNKQKIRLILIFFAEFILFPLTSIILFLSAIVTRFSIRKKCKHSLVWGEAPIINNVYWSNCMKEAGYQSETYTDSYCYLINERNEYDRVVQDEYLFVPLFLKYYLALFNRF